MDTPRAFIRIGGKGEIGEGGKTEKTGMMMMMTMYFVL
jgi:hypothetical protein